MIIPTRGTYQYPERLSEYPQDTCAEAGFLVTTNADWRNERPVLDMERCVHCLQCYLYCPDGVIKKTDTNELTIDYDYCKGCGICSKICKKQAITMEAED